MKTGIHPKYFDAAEIHCSCGNVIVIGSTQQTLKTELCSACHPFYTGQQKLVDTAGRVDKFRAKRELAKKLEEDAKERKEKKSKSKVEEYKEKEVPAEVLARAMKVEAKETASKWGKPLGETLTSEVKKEDEVLVSEEAATEKPSTKAKKTASKKK